MQALVARGLGQRIAWTDEQGYPWIRARVRDASGELEWHEWGIFEATGWVRVEPRQGPRPS